MFRGLSLIPTALMLAVADGNSGEHGSGSSGKPTEHETGSATDLPPPKASRKARVKPRAKYRLSAAQLQQRRNAAKARAKTLTKEHQAAAGKALARKRGNAYMQEMGTRGGEIARKRYPDLPERGGEANWERIKRLRAEKQAQAEQGAANSDIPTTGDTGTNGN